MKPVSIQVNIPKEEFKRKLGIQNGQDGVDGKDYILTSQDKKEIAKSIKVPIVEKVIEKVVVEKPIVKEIAIHETGDEIVSKIGVLKNVLDFQILTNIPDFVQQKDLPHSSGGGGSSLVTFQDEGTRITDNPITTLNVVGSGGALTYSGSGIATLTLSGGGGAGTVTDVSVVTANGVSGSVATSTTTPAITLTLGAITPSSVASIGTVTGSNLSGTNTGDQTSIVGITGTKAQFNTAVTDGDIVYQSQALGTPSSGTGTNITGIPAANILAGSFGAGAFVVSTTLTAGNFIATATTVPAEGMYRPTGAGNLGFAVSGAAELLLTATAFSPAVDGGNSLGTTALGWQNLFGNTGFVFNVENGDWVATHTSGILTIGTGTLKITTPTNTATSVATIDGTQTFTNKSIVASQITPGTFGSGAYSFGIGNAVTLGTIELGDASDTTLARVSAGVVSIEGVNIITTANISDTAYASSWDGVTTIAPSKNAIYDKIQTMLTLGQAYMLSKNNFIV